MPDSPLLTLELVGRTFHKLTPWPDPWTAPESVFLVVHKDLQAQVYLPSQSRLSRTKSQYAGGQPQAKDEVHWLGVRSADHI